MGQRWPRLIVIDGFAGPGRYQTGERGSPLIMLDALLEHSRRSQITAHVRYAFIERDAERIQHLRQELVSYRSVPNAGFSIETYLNEYEPQMKVLLNELGPEPPPMFVFVDPFGLADDAIDVTSRILGYRGCETLTYLPIYHIARLFVDQPQFAAHLDNLFGPGWIAAKAITSQRQRMDFLRHLYETELKKTCTFTIDFEIKDEAVGNSGYILCFGTNHPLGFTKMKEAMWTVDPVNGSCFRERNHLNQGALRLKPSPNTRGLRDLLMQEFKGRHCSIETVAAYTDDRTRFLSTSHLKRRTLLPMEEEGDLSVVGSGASPRRANTFPPGCILTFR
jgi:three-Cys-motif partner protein